MNRGSASLARYHQSVSHVDTPELTKVAGMPSHEATQTLQLDWHKASFCQTGECVEIAAHNDVVLMRSSRQPDSGYIYFTPEEFSIFLQRAKAGNYNPAIA